MNSADLVDDLSDAKVDTQAGQSHSPDPRDSVELTHPIDHVVEGRRPSEVQVGVEAKGNLSDWSFGPRGLDRNGAMEV